MLLTVIIYIFSNCVMFSKKTYKNSNEDKFILVHCLCTGNRSHNRLPISLNDYILETEPTMDGIGYNNMRLGYFLM